MISLTSNIIGTEIETEEEELGEVVREEEDKILAVEALTDLSDHSAVELLHQLAFFAIEKDMCK